MHLAMFPNSLVWLNEAGPLKSFLLKKLYGKFLTGSGTIDFDEFLIMMVMQIAEEGKTASEEELKDLFMLLDKWVI